MHKDKNYSTDMGNTMDRLSELRLRYTIGGAVMKPRELRLGYMIGGAATQMPALQPFARLMPDAALQAQSPHDVSCSQRSVLPVLPLFSFLSLFGLLDPTLVNGFQNLEDVFSIPFRQDPTWDLLYDKINCLESCLRRKF